MPDYLRDNRLIWYRETTGAELLPGAQAANGVTYYAEIPVGAARGFSATIDHDATDVSTFTLESTDLPPSAVEVFAVAAEGWEDHAVALGSKASAAAEGVKQFQVSDAESKRWRMKRVVTTGGVDDIYFWAKGN